MLDFEQGILIHDGKGAKIVRWEVWFRTIRGLHTTLPEAISNAKETDMPPEMIRTVSVAIDEDGRYEERL